MGRYAEAFRRSISDPEGFWGRAVNGIDWYREPTLVLDRSNPPFYRWFADGVLNTCFNAVDRHVRDGRGDQAALIYDSPVTGTCRTLTYRQLLDEVARFAGVLRGLGADTGDRVVIYMPMIPEAVVAMLACARIGAVHSVVFGGFAAHELAIRIEDAAPKVVVSASCGIEVSRVLDYKPILDRAIGLSSHKPHRCVILQRPQAHASLVVDRDVDWAQAMAAAEPTGCVPVVATDPLYILYTSGTTGRPKGVVRDNGGHAVALRWSMDHIYDTRPGEVYWAASDIGWVVGHSYIVYGPLLAGCTTVLYEGKPVGTPDAGAFWRVIAEHGIKTLFTAPTAFRAIKKEDPAGELARKHDMSRFRYLFLAGERLDPETYRWAGELLGIPVIDHWWQTETGWPIAADLMGLDPMATKPGSPTVPVPGYDVHVVDRDTGTDVPPGTTGEIVLQLPLPPGCLTTLWGDDQRFIDSYLSRYPGAYVTGDGGHSDGDGYLYVMGRTDDVINVAGHRLSTGEMEEVLASHPAVAECAVIGVNDPLKGQVPRGFVVLKAGSDADADADALRAELVELVRDQIGAVASLRRVDIVAGLPKTRSGKILRKTMRGIADGNEEPVPSTIDDPATLDALRPVLRDVADHGHGSPRALPGAAVGSGYAEPVLEQLDEAECLRLISKGGIGRIAYSGRFGPTVLPVNYMLHEGAIVFRTAEDSAMGEDLRTGIATAEYRVAFEIDEIDTATREGWSVLVRGSAHHVDSEPERASVLQAGVEAWPGGEKELFVRIIPSGITGRRVRQEEHPASQ